MYEYFLNGDIQQGKVASKITTFGWVCSSVPSHFQNSLDFPRLSLGILGDIARLKVIQSE